MSKVTDVPALRAAIVASDRSVVEEALHRSVATEPGRWLGEEHPLIDSSGRADLKRNKDDPPYTPAEVASIAEYCAASAYLHTADALSYLGRAVSAYIAGARQVAIHLFYYSELRSVHAMLARDGIVVMNGTSISLTSATNAVGLKPLLENAATHRATWDIFSAWAGEKSGDLLKEIVRVGGRTLSEWAGAWKTAGASEAIFKDLILTWGLDLDNLRADRDVRNVASYEPSGLAPSQESEDAQGASWLVEELWRVFEPSGNGNFEKFDLHIVRDVLEALKRASFSSGPPGNGLGLSGAEVGSVFTELGLEGSHQSLMGFFAVPRGERLLDRTAEAHSLGGQVDDRLIASVASRAVALIRLALGSVGSLSRNSGVSPEALEFWARDLLDLRGIDSEAAAIDLWSEISEALQDVGMFGDLLAAPPISSVESWGPAAQTLSTTERVVRWVQAA